MPFKPPLQSVPRLPWAALPMALVALAALYITYASWVLPLCAILLIAAQLSEFRFDNDEAPIRFGRYVIFAVLLFGAYSRFTSDTGGDSLEMIFAHTVGQLCAAEMAIQAWSRRPTGGSRSSAVVLLSMMVFLSASNTFDNRFIPFLTPLFFVCLGVALRYYARPETVKHRPVSQAASLALLLAVAMGAGIHFGVWQFRNEISQWGMRFLEGKSFDTSSAGLSTTPNLGSSFNVRGGLTRIMRTEGLPAFSYMRAMAFSDYRSGRWLPLLETRHFTNVPSAHLRAKVAGAQARIERVSADEGLLFPPLHAAGMEVPAANLEWQPELGPLRILVGEEDATPFYHVVLADDEYQGPLCAPPDAAMQVSLLQVPPEIDPRVRLLAEKIGGDAQTAREKVHDVEGYLITHNAYSLNARPGSGDKVSDFLLNRRSAHCEYFASAAVILLRCLGVPTRYVIGYLAHEPDGQDALVVRGRDAHAWAESYVEGGWTTVEATPGGGRPDGRAEPLPLSFKWREKLSAWVAAARSWLAQLRNLPVGIWIGLVGLLFAWLLVRAWRQRARTAHTEDFRYALRDAELAQLSVRFEKWLLKRGLPCPPGRIWKEHAQQVRLSTAIPFIDAYEAARFGPQSQDMNELNRLLHELENSTRNEITP